MGGKVTFSWFFNTMDYALPKDKYWESNPEYFALNLNGERTSEQYCLSNPEVIRLTAEYLISSHDGYSTRTTLYPLDNSVNCQCNDCLSISQQGGIFSDLWLQFTNKVTEIVNQTLPDLEVYTLAYWNTREPAKITKAVDNVVIIYAPIDVCYVHSMAECDTVFMMKNGTTTSGEDALDGWVNICDKVYIWDYSTNFARYLLFSPNFDSILDNIKMYAEKGVVGTFNQGNNDFSSGEFGSLRAYLIAKAMWDPYMSKEEYYGHMDDFLNGVYGPGWNYIREYIDMAVESVGDKCLGTNPEIDDIFKNTVDRFNQTRAFPEDTPSDILTNYNEVDWDKYVEWYSEVVPDELLVKGLELFNKALEACENDTQRYEIEKAMLHIQFFESIYRYEKIKYYRSNLTMSVREASLKYAPDISSSTLNKIVSEITVKYQTEYEQFNKDLVEKMIAHGVYKLNEAGLDLRYSEINYSKKPEKWLS